MQIENHIKSISAVKSTLLQYVEWFGHQISHVASKGKFVALKGASTAKAAWTWALPWLTRGYEFMKSKIGIFSVTMLAAGTCINKSYTTQNPIHRIALATLGIGFAMTSGAIAIQTGMLPTFL